MKILLVTSATAKSNTSRLNEEFIRQARERKHEVELLDSRFLHHCDGCRACAKSGGKCKHKDSLQNILWIDNFDSIVLSGAVYFFGLNSSLAMALHRMTPRNRIFGLMLCSGSRGRMGGVDLIIEQFKRIDEYGNNFTVQPYNKVTNDKRLPLSNKDIQGIEKLLCDLEGAYLHGKVSS